jgi:hypothetical protein
MFDKIDEIDVMKSVNPIKNKMQLFKTNESVEHSSGGRSGSFFFFTEDREFIIKTMSYEEKQYFTKHVLKKLY